MDDFYCDYCSREFTCKRSLDKHVSYCEIFYAAKHRKYNEMDNYEPAMTDKQRDVLVRHLVYQVKVLQDKVSKQQSELTYLKQRKKLTVLNYLNSLDTKPSQTIQQWFKSLNITQRHLDIVFQKTMKDGIMEILVNELEVMKMFQTIMPVKGYFQRPNLLYVYAESSETNTKQWIKLEKDLLKKLCTFIGSRFYEMYTQWQKDNEDEINSSPQAQEKDMMYLQKMLDDSFKSNQSINMIVEKIYNIVKTNFQTIEFD